VLSPPELPGSGAPEAPSSGIPGLLEDSSSGFEAGIPGVIEISSGSSAASAEVVPVFAFAALVLASLIVFAGWRLTQPAAARSPRQAPATPVASKVAAMAAVVKPAKPATPGDRLQRMSQLMVGCGAAVAVSAFLPWGSVVGESWSGFSWAWTGKVSLAMGLALAAYGAQGLRGDRTVRHHGWAIAAVVVLLSTASIAWTTLDTLSLGGLVEPGTGLMITVVAGALAIWPLVVLRRSAKAAAAADGTTFIADERPETEVAQ
jgi:hypothetical protein